MNELDRGVSAVLGCHSRVCRASLYLNENVARTLAPDCQGIRGITGLHVELDVAVSSERLDQLRGSGRAQLLTAIEQQSNRGIVPEGQAVENFEDGYGIHHTGLLIADAWPQGAIVLDPEGALGRRTRTKNGVHVSDDEDSRLARAMENGHQVRRDAMIFRRHRAHVSPGGLEALPQQRFHPLATLDVPGARIDIDDTLQKLQSTGATGLHGPVYLLIPFGSRICSGGDEQRQARDGEKGRGPDLHVDVSDELPVQPFTDWVSNTPCRGKGTCLSDPVPSHRSCAHRG